MSKPEIYFYIPKDKFSEAWPKTLSDNWVAFGGGANIWSYFTPIALREFGYPVRITTDIPDEGIVLSHSQYLPQRRITNNRTLLICIRADYGRNHPAQMHVVQNRDQAHYVGRDFLEHLLLPGPSYYIPQWPQPGLIRRDPARGDRFENVAYVGARQNLAKELSSDAWKQELNDIGLNFVTMFDRASWHDYSEADAVIAVRSMSSNRYLRKPPSKLTNAWLAGVPAILGPESAFRTLRQSEHDFIEVQSMKEAICAVRRLKDDLSLRRKMVEIGTERSREYSIEANAKRWVAFFDEFAIPYYHKWHARPWLYQRIQESARFVRTWIKSK